MNVVPFRPKKQPPRMNDGDVIVSALENTLTGEIIRAVDEEGAAIKLGLTVEEFRKQRPVPPLGDTGDDAWFSVDAVAAVMLARGIPVGTITPGGA